MLSVSQGAEYKTTFLRVGRKEKKVRISKDADNFMMVKVVSAARVNDPKSKKHGKMNYTTEETVKIYDATPESVAKVVMAALEAEARKTTK
jgi:hypothetical protein